MNSRINKTVFGFCSFSVCPNEAVAVAVINSSECNETCNKVVVSGGGGL
jgi:hypothetical protein